MRKYIVVLILFISVVFVGCNNQKINNNESAQESASIEGEYKKISSDEAKKIIENGDYDIILDVRSLEEYNEGHIKDAVLLPDNELNEKASKILPNKEDIILVYCRSGRRSKSAAKALVDMGYSKVYDFGGIIDWKGEIVTE